MLRGAYHFANPAASSGADQARIFVNGGGVWSPDGYTLPPVLDFEANPYAGQTIGGYYQGNTCYDMSPGTVDNLGAGFRKNHAVPDGAVARHLHQHLVVEAVHGDATGFGDYPLWTAYWPSSASNYAGPLPSGWRNYSFWQYSESGPFAGDSNVWNGSYADLRTFARNSVPRAALDAIAAFTSSSSVMGSATSGITCGLRGGGCFQGFAKGVVMWSPATGAQPSLLGPIRDAWARSGYENGAMGYPTSGVICGLKNSGCFQNYQGGAIMWSPASGAALSTFGAIRNFWQQQKFENGPLGYPTSNPVCGLTGGGCFQNFQGGTVMWSPASGAQTIVPGQVRQVWQRSGYEAGTLGYPTGKQQCNSISQQCNQTFQRGTAA